MNRAHAVMVTVVNLSTVSLSFDVFYVILFSYFVSFETSIVKNY